MIHYRLKFLLINIESSIWKFNVSKLEMIAYHGNKGLWNDYGLRGTWQVERSQSLRKTIANHKIFNSFENSSHMQYGAISKSYTELYFSYSWYFKSLIFDIQCALNSSSTIYSIRFWKHHFRVILIILLFFFRSYVLLCWSIISWWIIIIFHKRSSIVTFRPHSYQRVPQELQYVPSIFVHYLTAQLQKLVRYFRQLFICVQLGALLSELLILLIVEVFYFCN